ncbi:sensor histidine kinase [Amycolatopsis jiangsuensis]|nr:HAMP domain-containing sensor histidine kinase [Amycolatopsis jiangsuensis]
MTLRARLTLIHTGLFLVASLVVVGLVYVFNRNGIVRAQRSVAPKAPVTAPTGAVPGTSAATTRSQPVSTGEALGDLMTSQLVLSLLTFVVLGAIAGVLSWWLSGRLLRRVHLMTAQAQSLSTANLHKRIALAGPHDELKELADTFDDLLGRLDDAFQVQGRFIANASHELRTPLAVTRTVIQVGLSSAEPGDVQRARDELLRINDRSIDLISGLLQLARGEQELRHRERVRLDQVAVYVLQESPAGVVTFDVRTASCTVLGDELLLSQLIGNLVQNAVRYNNPGGTVSVRVGVAGEHGRLEVCNTGPVVPAEDVGRLFEPFQRGGTPRTGASTGSGLGLSIVRAISTAHDGKVTAEANPRGGLTVAVEIPLARR